MLATRDWDYASTKLLDFFILFIMRRCQIVFFILNKTKQWLPNCLLYSKRHAAFLLFLLLMNFINKQNQAKKKQKQQQNSSQTKPKAPFWNIWISVSILQLHFAKIKFFLHGKFSKIKFCYGGRDWCAYLEKMLLVHSFLRKLYYTLFLLSSLTPSLISILRLISLKNPSLSSHLKITGALAICSFLFTSTKSLSLLPNTLLKSLTNTLHLISLSFLCFS